MVTRGFFATAQDPYGSNSSTVQLASSSPWLHDKFLIALGWIPWISLVRQLKCCHRFQGAASWRLWKNSPTERPWHGKHDLEILVVSHGFLVVSQGFPYVSLNQWTNAMIWSWCFSMRTERQPSRVIHLFQASSNPPAGWQPIFLGWNPHEIDGRLQELISKADQPTHHA
jgi:hypothetical protein